MTEQTITKQIIERKDSVEIGTASKGGALKVYFDATDPEQAKTLIDNAIKVREYLHDNNKCSHAIITKVEP